MNTTINKIALVACSNPYKLINKPKLNNLVTILSSMNLEVVVSPFIFEDKSTPSNRANIFMEYMLDPSISIIFDISGGDLCNEILDFIDFDKLKENTTLYCGYSDNSVLINALYAKCNITSLNYQITRLLGVDSLNQIKYFNDMFLENKNNLIKFSYNWISVATEMSGIVVGGNLRCTLKLAGTSYIPNFNNTILFIESLGGDENKVKTYLTQFKQIGAFSNLNGLIIGEFTELQNALGYDAPINILKSIIDINQIPIIQTRELGHDQSSKAIFIGKHQLFI